MAELAYATVSKTVATESGLWVRIPPRVPWTLLACTTSRGDRPFKCLWGNDMNDAEESWIAYLRAEMTRQFVMGYDDGYSDGHSDAVRDHISRDAIEDIPQVLWDTNIVILT